MIVDQLGRRGFSVESVVSDMGAANQAMWKAAGVLSNRCKAKTVTTNVYR